mgnify:CR=1 FL=1
MALPKLTPKQAAFVHEYLVDLNATQAAIRAGYSEKTARSVAAENLAKPNIQQAIQEARDAREKRSMITVEWVLAQIASIAQDEEAQQRDRLKALELLGKHLGMWERREDTESQGVKVCIDTETEVWAE